LAISCTWRDKYAEVALFDLQIINGDKASAIQIYCFR